MKSNYLLIYFLLLSAFGFSQNYEAGGTVKEADTGLPIPGANVTIVNSTQSAATDFDGKFLLKDVPNGSVIVFSSVGFKNYRYTVNASNKSIKVALLADSKSLDEVVVIGYGTQKRKDITGSVSVVGSKVIDQIKPIKTEQALMGTVAGVFVAPTSGSPGAGFDIKVRGVHSNGVNRPLYIVDGAIEPNLEMLNPSDIESLTVLKDVQTAVYGTRGANGVILVTTKRGKRNTSATFSYNAYTGMQQTTKKLKLLNATEYALLLNESYATGGKPIPYPNVSALGAGTDWQDEVFGNNVPIVSHDLSVSGGSDKMTYSFSGSHLYQQGIVGGDKADFRRNTAKISLGADLTSKLKLESNFNYLYLNRDALSENGLGSVLFNAINTPATIKPYDSNGNYSLVPSTPGFGVEVINPLAQIANTFNDYNQKKLNGFASLDYSVLKELTFTTHFGFFTSNSESKSFAKIVDYGGKVFDNLKKSSVSQSAINDNSYTLDLYLTYKKRFGENHNFIAALGTTSNKDWGNGLFATGFDVPNNSWEFADIALAQGPTTTPPGSYAYDERLNSFFARLQYEYAEKYLFQAILRRDSSTKFGPDHAIGYFPSVLGGWVISKENFLKDSKTFNFIKVRGSYGIVGSDAIGSNGYVGLLGGEGSYVFDNVITNGRAIGLLANPDLHWEESRKLDIGLDLKLFDNQIDITTDYFVENRHDLLIAGLPVSGITGVYGPGGQSPFVNAGSLKNVGFEASLGYTKKIAESFSASANVNFTTIDNVVTKVSNARGIIETGSFGVGQQPISRMEEGKSIGYFYGWQTDGIFQNQAEVDAHPSQVALGAAAAPGDIRYKDINGDGVIDLKDRTQVGSPLPDFTMGFNLLLNYKNVDFALYSYASVGNDMVRNYERSVSDVNKMNYVLGRWTGEGTSNTVPRVTTDATENGIFSDYFVEDASFYRIQNIQLGYTLNSAFSQKAGISKLRLYAGVNNVYTFTKYRGFDPAAANGAAIGEAIDNGFYPTPRTYMIGLNLNF